MSAAGRLCCRASEIWLRVTPGVGLERGVDFLFGERVAGGAWKAQRLSGAPARARARGPRRVDRPFAVGECVEERETNRVRSAAGAERAGDTPRGLGGGELGVGVAPELACLLVQA